MNIAVAICTSCKINSYWGTNYGELAPDYTQRLYCDRCKGEAEHQVTLVPDGILYVKEDEHQ